MNFDYMTAEEEVLTRSYARMERPETPEPFTREWQHDIVNSPSHYMVAVVDPDTGETYHIEHYWFRQAILRQLDDLGTPAQEIDDWSRAFEYLGRMWGKNGLEDAKKARWYLDKLIEKLEATNARTSKSTL